MYAVIATGGKQYRVQPGETIQVEKLEGAKEQGAVTFDQVLLVADGAERQGRRSDAAGRQGHRRGAGRQRPRREAPHLQVPPPQGLPPEDRPSPALHRGEDHRHHGLRTDADGSQKRTGRLAQRSRLRTRRCAASSASAASRCAPATSWFVRRAPSSTPARTSASDATYTIFALVDGVVEFTPFKCEGHRAPPRQRQAGRRAAAA